MTRQLTFCAALAATVLLPLRPAAQSGSDWPSNHHDLAGQRFSPLKQITPANVATLQQAWTFDTDASPLQTTPIVADGVMYLTGGRGIFAIEPETGKS